MDNETTFDDGADLVGAPALLRAAKRNPKREEDPRLRAARRAAELREHIGDSDEGTDEFRIPASDIPPGWTYEWKRKTMLGAEDPAYQVALTRTGWEPVPTARHPEYMPSGGNYPIIERKGMILMERPLEISEESRARELRKARLQVHHKESQLTAPGVGELERSNQDKSLVKVRKSYEAIPVPE